MKLTSLAGFSCWCPIYIALILFSLPVRTHAFPSAFNLQQYVSGTVMDESGLPLPGVNIVIKDRGAGTMSDENGKYTIAVQDTDILIFSFVGFKTEEIPVKGQTSINVQLEEDVTTLNEVTVNAGYYTVRERERTGNISRVTSEELELQPVVNPLQALQGRMPGVSITQNSNIPGASGTIRIRGRNSLRSEGNLPLYIIDGVPVNSSPITSSGGLLSISEGIYPLNTLNLSNIESIEVLKDADATAIYGSRGANGVILITTKKGREGKTDFNLGMYSGAGRISKKLKLLNTPQYLEMRREAFINSGETPTESNAPDLLLWDPDRHTDWQEELLGHTAFITDIQASVSGGNAQTSFLFGGGYHREDMVFPGDFGYQKITGNFNLNHTSANQKFQTTLSVNYGIDNHKSFNDGLFIQKAILLPPHAPSLYHADGTLNWENGTWTNPLSYLKKSQEVDTDNLVTNAVLSYQLAKGLTVKSNLGYTNLHSEELTKNPKSSNNPASESENSSQHRTTKRQSWIVEPQLTYTTTIGNGKLEALIGTTFQKSMTHVRSITGQGYAEESLIGNLAAVDEQNVLFQEDTEYAYTAIFGRIGYQWKRKYFLNLTGRRDGSSRFGPNNRFSNFGAIGGAWIFSEELFIKKKIPFLSFGKFRGSYGTTGSDQIADYGYYDTYRPTRGTGGLYPTGLANPDYSWEVNKKLEFAGELGFFNDRLMFTASWYRNRSSNQLVGYALPAITGFTSIQANLPATVENTGWELELFSRLFQTDDFTWNTSLNISFPKNTLVAFPDIDNSSYANTYKVGASLNSVLLYQSLGVNPETGLYEVADTNTDGRYDFEDRTVVKDLGQKYFGGVQNTIRYKNLSLDFFMEFVGQDGRNTLALFRPPGRNMENQLPGVLNRWTQPGDQAYMQQYSITSTANMAYERAAGSDMAISDASFLRLKTISLSYRIPSVYTEKIGLNDCKIYLHGQNLWTITRYKGPDPQSAPAGSLSYLPPLRTITAGVQLHF
ncbi:SusC/RagA family TonB-linked outer membrane protein [Sinomicrobium weinanense]|uniref:TonB-dependent receptor n=1 Tax=Sinomicrobium weinanense TaxID=2842200 RepID=A0A926Q2V8_9FLAO|nr:TonB-dependent receptor [Sinomicrobium weinanense]MBC9797032.1 TonB-dependent receptor [Sinomicrobium weinanense]MBU3122027.1 TonB-dependent receptor [Sinomicrobium weinanense]